MIVIRFRTPFLFFIFYSSFNKHINVNGADVWFIRFSGVVLSCFMLSRSPVFHNSIIHKTETLIVLFFAAIKGQGPGKRKWQ